MDDIEETRDEQNISESLEEAPLREIADSLRKVTESLEQIRYVIGIDYQEERKGQFLQQAMEQVRETFGYRTRLIELTILAAAVNAALFALATEAPFPSRLMYVVGTILFITTCAIEAWQVKPGYAPFNKRDRWAVYIFLAGLAALVIATVIPLFST